MHSTETATDNRLERDEIGSICEGVYDWREKHEMKWAVVAYVRCLKIRMARDRVYEL